jgi:hypothetical protein
MNDTEQLFVAAAVWALIAAVIARLIPTWPGRIAFFAIAVGLPFWELPYGYYNFVKLCKDEGGLRVFAEIAPQRTICADYPFDASAQTLNRFGFATVEARSKTGEVIQFIGAASESIPQTKAKSVSSDYCVTFVNNNVLPWRVYRHDFVILRSKDGSIVARHSVFDWAGMWWQQATSPILGNGGGCREDPIHPVMTALHTGSKKSSERHQ